MKKILYQKKVEGNNNELFLNIQIMIYFNEEQNLVISGFESGNIVKDITSNFNYDYYLSIPIAEIQKLIILIQKENKDDIINFFIINFSNEDCIEQIKEFCKTNNINYDFSVWL